MPSKKSPINRGKKITPVDSTAIFEKLLKRADAVQQYQLRLYITGTTPRSSRAIANIRALCEEYLAGKYDLEVIDIYQQPDQAAKEQIIAAPTLILWGDADGIAAPVYAQEFAQRIAGAKVALIDGAGHLPQLEQQEQVAAAVAKFLG